MDERAGTRLANAGMTGLSEEIYQIPYSGECTMRWLVDKVE